MPLVLVWPVFFFHYFSLSPPIAGFTPPYETRTCTLYCFSSLSATLSCCVCMCVCKTIDRKYVWCRHIQGVRVSQNPLSFLNHLTFCSPESLDWRSSIEVLLQTLLFSTDRCVYILNFGEERVEFRGPVDLSFV